MSSREEKLAAARKKLREFQVKSRDVDITTTSRVLLVRNGSDSSSSSPSLNVQEIVRPESPLDSSRISWERRETLDVGEAQLQRQCAIDKEKSLSPVPDSQQNQTDQSQNYQQREALYQEQLRRQNQAINVLVSERNDAQTALSRVQAQLHEKSDALEDLKNRLKDAMQRVHDLELLPTHRSSPSINLLQDESQARELENSKQMARQLQDQVAELRQKLEGKSAMFDKLNSQYLEIKNELSVAEVKIQQLSTGETPAACARINELEKEKTELVSRISLLERRLQAAALEAEQSAHRFQMYADQCASQIGSIRSQYRSATEKAEEYRQRYEELEKRVAEAQQQLQQVQTTEDSMHPNLQVLNDELQKSLIEKDSELTALQLICTQNGERVAALETEIIDLQQTKRQLEAKIDSVRADPALLAAMESDKVAASRAIAQNHKLKDQLTELQSAFVRLSNEKSELTEQLAHETHENRELKKQLESHAQNDETCTDEDEEEEIDIDTLRHLVSGLRRDKTQLMLRLKHLTENSKPESINHHYHSEEHHEHKHHHDHEENCDNHDHEHDHHHENHGNHSPNESFSKEEVDELKRAVEQLQADKAELLKRLEVPTDNPEIHGLLETKLRKTMDEIAALDEEKQKLEHLVLQLQGETETIGEYISLYQKQRMLLRQRSQEKDEQLILLSKDREDLRTKLESLNELVEKLMQGGGSPEKTEDVTAARIRELINEIGSNNVVRSNAMAFEHCSCCSGRLITV